MSYKVYDENWLILNKTELSIKNKIEAIGVPLCNWNLNINRGVLTGYNDAFIIDENTKNSLIKEDPKSAEIIRPILRGKDIKKYKYVFAKLYLIATFPSQKLDIYKYPAIKKYLLSFGKEKLEQTGEEHIVNGVKIKARKKTNNKWFETQDSIAYWDDFYKQKIIYSEIVQSPQFYLDYEGYFPEATTFIMTGNNLEFVTACLNSKLYSYCFKKFYSGGGLGEHGYRYKKVFLEKLPLPKINDKNILQEIKALVINIQNNTNNKEITNYINQIDNILFELAGITDDEKKVINSC